MTGGLFSSVLGRVLGIDRKRVFLAVVAGSAIGAVPMGIAAYVATQSVLDALQSPSAQTVGAAAGILITIAFVAAVVVLYFRGKGNENRG
jgi:phage shock protein PspC (stress-responsive transcriptional regulator)